MIFYPVIPQDLRTIASPTFDQVNVESVCFACGAGVKMTAYDASSLSMIPTTDANSSFILWPYSKTSTNPILIQLINKADYSDLSVAEYFLIRHDPGVGGSLRMYTGAIGAGVQQPITIYTSSHTSQFKLNIDGSVTIGNGSLFVSAGSVSAMGLSIVGTGSVSGEFISGNLTIGYGAGGVDYSLTFNGESSDGIITWMEDEDWFQFSDTVKFDLGIIKKIETKTANYTATQSDYTILADATSNTVTITLPATPNTGQIYNIKCTNDTYTCTVGRNGKNIDGDASDIVLVEDESITVQYDGTEWWII